MNLRHIIIGMMVSITTTHLSATNLLDIEQTGLFTEIKLYLSNAEIIRLNNTCRQLNNTTHTSNATLEDLALATNATNQSVESAYSAAQRWYQQAPCIRDFSLDFLFTHGTHPFNSDAPRLLALLEPSAHCAAIYQIVNDITTKKKFSDCNAIHTIQPSHLADASKLINLIIVLKQGINLTSLTIDTPLYATLINKLIDNDATLASKLLPRLQKLHEWQSLMGEYIPLHTKFFTNGQRLMYIKITNLEPLVTIFSNKNATTLTNLKKLLSDRYSNNEIISNDSASFDLVVKFLTKHPQLQHFNCSEEWSNKALNEAKKQNPSLNIQEMAIEAVNELKIMALTRFLPQLTIITLTELSYNECSLFLDYVKEFGLPNAQHVVIAGEDINDNTTWTAEDGEGIKSLLTQCPQLTQLSLEGLPNILDAVHAIPPQSHLQTLTIDSRCIGYAFDTLKQLCAINNPAGKPLTTHIIIDCNSTEQLTMQEIFEALPYKKYNAYTFTFVNDSEHNGIYALNGFLHNTNPVFTPLHDTITELAITLPAEESNMLTPVLEHIFARCTNLTDLALDYTDNTDHDLVIAAIIHGIRLGYNAAQQQGRTLPLRTLRIPKRYANAPQLQPNALYQYFPNLVTHTTIRYF